MQAGRPRRLGRLKQVVREKALSTNTNTLMAAGSAAEKVVEAHLQPVWRREDTVVAGACLRPAPLQTHAAVRHGRDRRGPRLQKRLHRRQLHQGANSQRTGVRGLAGFSARRVRRVRTWVRMGHAGVARVLLRCVWVHAGDARRSVISSGSSAGGKLFGDPLREANRFVIFSPLCDLLAAL